MLDLTTMTGSKKLYEIKMPDGEILKLKMPSQGLLIKLMDMQKNMDTQDPLSVLDSLTDITTEILNLNTANKKFTKEEIGNMLDLTVMMMVMQDYFAETTKTLGE